jgi:hypothetical protein
MSRPLAWLAAVIVSLAFLVMISPGLAHESWISQGALRNAAGEFCCGDVDCPALNYTPRVTAGGYLLQDGEVVPFSEVQPSPDGTYVRYHRPDGSRRCFFAPPPGS